MELGKMPKKFLQLVKTRFFYEFLKIVKSALFQNTTEQENRLKKSGYSVICDVIQGLYLGQSLLRLQERKCRINALFSDAATGQTRERAYLFIQFLLTELMTRRSAKEERSGST